MVAVGDNMRKLAGSGVVQVVHAGVRVRPFLLDLPVPERELHLYQTVALDPRVRAINSALKSTISRSTHREIEILLTEFTHDMGMNPAPAYRYQSSPSLSSAVRK